MTLSMRNNLLFSTTTLAATLFFAGSLHAQQAPVLLASNDAVPAASVSSSAETSSALPDSPDATLRAYSLEADHALAPGGKPASRFSSTIEPDQTAERLSSGDKVILGLRNTVSLTSLGGAVISAGYSHLVNGQPNYGTNGTAFGKRFGASLARGASQNIFTYSVLAPVFHTDERYYVLGAGHNVLHRSIYAATRVLVAKTDGGRSTINAPLLVGYAGAAALTNTYYPQINRNFKDTASGYGGSLGGAALGYLVNEFQSDILRAVHLKKN